MSNNSKSTLRKVMKSKVSALSWRTREEKDKRISDELALFMVNYYKKNLSTQGQSILNLGVYAPLSDEVSWQKAVEKLDFIQLSYPSFESEGVMVFRRVSCDEELKVSNRFGTSIGEPTASSPIVVPDICLIPGLSFSIRGNRLGRGKGYYDRYLQNFCGVKIGIGYSEQLEEELPCEEHDEQLDGIVTDEGFYYNGNLLSL